MSDACVHFIMAEIDARCIKTVYQTYVFARMATRFDYFEYRRCAALRVIGLMPLPDVV